MENNISYWEQWQIEHYGNILPEHEVLNPGEEYENGETGQIK